MSKDELILEFDIENRNLVERIPGFEMILEYPTCDFDNLNHYEYGRLNFKDLMIRFRGLGRKKKQDNLIEVLKVIYQRIDSIYSLRRQGLIKNETEIDILQALLPLIRRALKDLLDEEIK